MPDRLVWFPGQPLPIEQSSDHIELRYGGDTIDLSADVEEFLSGDQVWLLESVQDILNSWEFKQRSTIVDICGLVEMYDQEEQPRLTLEVLVCLDDMDKIGVFGHLVESVNTVRDSLAPQKRLQFDRAFALHVPTDSEMWANGLPVYKARDKRRFRST